MKTLLNTKKALELKIIAIEVDCKLKGKTKQDKIDITTLDKELVKIEKEIKNKELNIEIEVEQKIEVNTIAEDKKAQKKDIKRFNNFKKLTITKLLKSTSSMDVVAITEFIKGLCQGLNIDKERMNKARIEVLATYCKLQNDKLESKGILEVLTERFENS